MAEPRNPYEAGEQVSREQGVVERFNQALDEVVDIGLLNITEADVWKGVLLTRATEKNFTTFARGFWNMWRNPFGL